MTVQLSFSAQEQDIRSHFREMMDRAESTEDVKKFFYQTVRELLTDICDTLPELNIEDLQLDLERGEGYQFSKPVMASLESLIQGSDLNNILDRLSEKAWNRYRRLEKNPAKTEQKIYPVPGH